MNKKESDRLKAAARKVSKIDTATNVNQPAMPSNDGSLCCGAIHPWIVWGTALVIMLFIII
jgi:hypothetical protein